MTRRVPAARAAISRTASRTSARRYRSARAGSSGSVGGPGSIASGSSVPPMNGWIWSQVEKTALPRSGAPEPNAASRAQSTASR
jgi:hypothetical protein